MAILCMICQENLTERPQVLGEGEDLIMLALACGHLFHRVCVTQWFRRGSAHLSSHNPEGHCPCCKKHVFLNNTLRIYPMGDDEGLANLQQEMSKDMAVELREARRQLARTRSSLEEEMTAHDNLKLRYAQNASRLDSVQIQLEDCRDMQLAVEHSFKSALGKSESERKDALQKIHAMETKSSEVGKKVLELKGALEKMQRETVRKQEEDVCKLASLFVDLETAINIGNPLESNPEHPVVISENSVDPPALAPLSSSDTQRAGRNPFGSAIESEFFQGFSLYFGADPHEECILEDSNGSYPNGPLGIAPRQGEIYPDFV